MNPITLKVLIKLERVRKGFLHQAWRLTGRSQDGRPLPADFSGQPACSLIQRSLETSDPLFIGWIGRTERDVILRTRNVQSAGGFWTKFARYIFKNSSPFWWDEKIRTNVRNLVGFFPTDDENLERFAGLMLQDLQTVDILAAFGDEGDLRAHFPQAKIIPLTDLEPYYHSDPWTQALEGRKVLVVHPYETSIRNQYARRSSLFNDARILPDFELKTLKAVQSIAGNPVGFSTWFEALDWMKGQMEQIDFDIAIIGAGFYGFPLTAHVKRMGKKGIHLAGATQLLFGIRGKRWDGWSFYRQLINENWVRPSSEETPQDFQKVEDGCYW